MKKKNCKLAGILRAIALPLVGSAGGFLYYRYVAVPPAPAPLHPARGSPPASAASLGRCCIPSCGPAAAKGRTATGQSDPCSP